MVCNNRDIRVAKGGKGHLPSKIFNFFVGKKHREKARSTRKTQGTLLLNTFSLERPSFSFNDIFHFKKI